TQNTRALLDLRQLHQDVILSVTCDSKEFDKRKIVEWTTAIRRARATILPDYGAYANLDVGGSSQRLDSTPNRGRDDQNRGPDEQNRGREPQERPPPPTAAISTPPAPSPAAATPTPPAPSPEAATPTPPAPSPAAATPPPAR